MAPFHGSISAREQEPRPRVTADGRRPVPRRVVGVGLLTVVGALLLYVRTMAPTVYGLDSAELTAGAYVLGIVHAPGSPTYLLLGHLFTWLPFGDVGYRVNLLSACAGAVGAGFVYAVVWMLLGDDLLALTAAWYLATTYYVWVNAVAAEIYALHVCWIAGLIWLGLLWRAHPRFAWLYLFTFLFGLGLGAHLSLSLLTPGFAILIVGGRARWLRPHALLLAVLCGLLGASVYLYLPLRAAAGVGMNYARDFGVDVTTWDGFWWMVSGRMFGPQMFGVPLGRLPWELVEYGYRLWSNFLGLGCVIGVVGVGVLFRRDRSVTLALGTMWLAHVGFVTAYDVPDKEMMLAPTFLIWSIWVAAGAASTMGWVARRLHGSVPLPAALLLLLMAGTNVLINYPRADISSDWSARARGELLLDWLPPQTLYLATWADAPILDYLQQAEQRRLDIDTVNVFLVRDRRQLDAIAAHLAAGLPVYADQPALAPNRSVRSEYIAACRCYWVTIPLPQSFPPAAPLQCQDPGGTG